MVLDQAQVYGHGHVIGCSVVFGRAQVCDRAILRGSGFAREDEVFKNKMDVRCPWTPINRMKVRKAG